MASFQLDDLLRDDKKDANSIPDLSKATCNSQEEFRRLLECVPDFKLRAEKVRREDIKVREKEFSFKTTRKELRALKKEWSHGNPVPPEMRSLNLQELQRVPIDWRMLTPLRPKLRQDEEFFSRLVELGKLQLKTRRDELREKGNEIRRVKNRAGIIETSVPICGECGEEFCNGEACCDVLYDSFMRISVTPNETKSGITTNAAAIIANMDSKQAGKPKKKRRKGGLPKASKSNKSGKSPRLLLRKGSKLASSGNGRKESNCGLVNESAADGKRKFRRKCSKYPQISKRKQANSSSKS